RVHAAVVELDALADPVRPGAEDDDALRVTRRRGLVVLAPSRVEVVRLCLDLAGAGVDAAVDRPLALLPGFFGLERRELVHEPRMQVLGVPVEWPLESALRLRERLEERAPDAHRL